MHDVLAHIFQYWPLIFESGLLAATHKGECRLLRSDRAAGNGRIHHLETRGRSGLVHNDCTLHVDGRGID